MATVKCPECGERVKLREDGKLSRCAECGTAFRVKAADDGEDDREEEEERPRPKRRPAAKKKPSGTKLVAIIVGGLLVLGLVALAVVMIVRKGKDGDSPPADQAKVTAENFKNVKPGMDLAEVEGILGGSQSSSEEDMRNGFRKAFGEIDAAVETGWARFGEGTTWRRWEGKNVRIWVAFARTKEGSRAAFSTGLEQSGGTHKRLDGFMTFAGNTDLDEQNAQRKKEDAVRKDAKWVRGQQARALLLGEWRTEMADALILGPDGVFMEQNAVTMNLQKRPTFRIVDDRKLEVTHPPLPTPPSPPGAPPSPFVSKPFVREYEYYVNQEELALIEITPHAVIPGLALRIFYRIPATPGGLADRELVAPFLADIKGNDPVKRQVAFFKLKRLGPGAPGAVQPLIGLLNHSDEKVVFAACDTLGEMKEVAAPAVPALTELLRDPNSKRALPAVLALARIGPAAKDALPALRELVKKTKDNQTRHEAEGLIRRLEGGKP